MSAYAVVALLMVERGVTQEASREFDTLDSALDGIREVVEGDYDWSAFTLVRSADLPRVMRGASPS